MLMSQMLVHSSDEVYLEQKIIYMQSFLYTDTVILVFSSSLQKTWTNEKAKKKKKNIIIETNLEENLAVFFRLWSLDQFLMKKKTLN